MSAPVVFLGLLAQRNAAATQWSAPVTPGGGSADFDQRPLMITVLSWNGSSGFMIIGYSKWTAPGAAFGSPGPPASGTHQPGAMPCGTKIAVNRGFGAAAVFEIGVCAGTIESSNGNARVTPAPLRTVRRERCFLVMNISALLNHYFTVRGAGFSLPTEALASVCGPGLKPRLQAE